MPSAEKVAVVSVAEALPKVTVPGPESFDHVSVVPVPPLRETDEAEGGLAVRQADRIGKRQQQVDRRVFHHCEAGQRGPEKIHAGGGVFEAEAAVGRGGTAAGIGGDGAEREGAAARGAGEHRPALRRAPEGVEEIHAAARTVEDQVQRGSGGDGDAVSGETAE